MINRFLFFTCLLLLGACQGSQNKIRIGFIDIVEDATLAEARKGFFSALRDSGFIKDENIDVIYRNAQGDIPVLTQSVEYMISSGVQVIATNTTLCTITASQRTTSIPVCMMVSPSPEIAGLTTKDGKAPANLMGVYETLEYIDTAMALIPSLFPKAKKVGTLINQSEPQSVDALERIKQKAAELGLEIISLPANSSAETQLVTERLIAEGIDVFFALPDNTIFASFETIAAACEREKIPIITSESGLVSRGALAAFGANMYQWGYDSGLECARFLKSGKHAGPIKLVHREKLINAKLAKDFGIIPDSSYRLY